MKGYSHALSGAAGWLAVSTTTHLSMNASALPLSANIAHASEAVALTGAIVTAGAALAPDADHGQATIAYSLPPFSKWGAELIGACAGGHRHGTHSLVGIAVFTVIAWLASFLTYTTDSGRTVALGAGIIAVPLVAFAIKGLGIRFGRKNSILNTGLGPWLVSLGTAGIATWFLDYTWSWLPLSVGLGTFLHVLGDSLTLQGVPWLWPLKPKPPEFLHRTPVLHLIAKHFWHDNGWFGVPVMGETKSNTTIRETLLDIALALYILVVAFQLVSGMVK